VHTPDVSPNGDNPEVSLFSEVLVDLSAAADLTLISKILYSRKEASYALSVSTRLLDTWVAAGRLKARRVGGRVLIHRTELEKFALKDHATLSQTSAT
jgi:excisionase family DNA binding protein